MLYNPHCAPLFSSNYMLANQLQKMCFVTPIASGFPLPSATYMNAAIGLCRGRFWVYVALPLIPSSRNGVWMS